MIDSIYWYIEAPYFNISLDTTCILIKLDIYTGISVLLIDFYKSISVCKSV